MEEVNQPEEHDFIVSRLNFIEELLWLTVGKRDTVRLALLPTEIIGNGTINGRRFARTYSSSTEHYNEKILLAE